VAGRLDDGKVPAGAAQTGRERPGHFAGSARRFLAGLPFAVVAGVALVDVLAGPGVGFLPVLSLGPALAAISRPPLPTARIEASLQHQEAEEEFVTAVLAQISADGCRAEILNCGHPPPLLVRDGEVTAAEPTEASLPLGLAALTPQAREISTIVLKHGDRLLFYTDGITEARDRQGAFYPLERSGALLGLPELGSALDRLIDDVLRHVGHALQGDAALLIGRGASG
jgi:Stage II sporulation protein E (SpoIIE)